MTTSPPLFAIGTRKSTIANVVVRVVQRIKRRFPNAKTEFLEDFAGVISSEQMIGFKRVE